MRIFKNPLNITSVFFLYIQSKSVFETNSIDNNEFSFLYSKLKNVVKEHYYKTNKRKNKLNFQIMFKNIKINIIVTQIVLPPFYTTLFYKNGYNEECV